MKVQLVTRYKDPSRKEGVGIGSVSDSLLYYLSQQVEAQVVSTKGSGLISYFLYSTLGVPTSIRWVDIYHALSPIESLWVPKEKSVTTFHDLFQITDPDKIGGGMGYSTFRKRIGISFFTYACLVGVRSKRIVCVSEKTKKEVISILKAPEEKVRVIRWGINPSLKPFFFKRVSPNLKVGYLGMLDKRKRVNLLIDAFINRKFSNSLLTVAGRGLDSNKLEKQARGEVHFPGFIPNSQLAAFYNALDLFIFPSALEGYGLPIVEAMACGTPVVVLKDSKIPSEVKSRCIQVESLSEVFNDLGYTSTLIKNNDIEGNIDFAREHDWNQCTRKYLEVYKEVINEA